MHEGQRSLFNLLLQELHALDLFNCFGLQSCQSRVHVSATPLTYFKVMYIYKDIVCVCVCVCVCVYVCVCVCFLFFSLDTLIDFCWS